MTHRMKFLLLTATAMTAISAVPAAAADLPTAYKAPPPLVDPFDPWLIRLRAVGVIPRDHGRVETIAGGPGVPGETIAVSKTVIPEIDISYFFTRNIAVELIIGTTPHTLTGQNNLDGLQIGKTWLIPLTPTLQYHFTNFGAFKPYVGAGPNYTIFYNTSADQTPALTPSGTISVTHLAIKNTWGAAAQVGFDYFVTKNVGLNVDVKKLWLRPDYTGTLGGTVAIAGKADLDPWLIGGGVFYKF